MFKVVGGGVEVCCGFCFCFVFGWFFLVLDGLCMNLEMGKNKLLIINMVLCCCLCYFLESFVFLVVINFFNMFDVIVNGCVCFLVKIVLNFFVCLLCVGLFVWVRWLFLI